MVLFTACVDKLLKYGTPGGRYRASKNSDIICLITTKMLWGGKNGQLVRSLDRIYDGSVARVSARGLITRF